MREASYFVERLRSEDMPLGGLIVNRVQAIDVEIMTAETALAAAERLTHDAGDEVLTARLLELHADRLRIRERQRHITERFTGAHPGVAVAQVPALAGDVHDMTGLAEVGDLLCATRSL